MKRTWILVAHRAGAKLYEHAAFGEGLRLVKDINHPEGKLSNREIVSDRPGRSFTSPSLGVHPMSPEEDPKERILANFCRDLSKQLESGCYENKCDSVVLIAEPHLLGKLKDALGTNTTKKLAFTIDRDLVHAEDTQILEALKEFGRF